MSVPAVIRIFVPVIVHGITEFFVQFFIQNKDTDNSRNGHSQKTMHTSYGDMEVAIPRDRNGILIQIGRAHV